MTIFGVDVGAPAFPETYDNAQQTVKGWAADGSPQMFEVGRSRRYFPVYLNGLTAAKVDELRTALEASRFGAIVPEAHIDLGEGDGFTVFVLWRDRSFRAVRGTAGNQWGVDLQFQTIRAFIPGAETELMYLKSEVEIIGTESSPEQFETNVGKLATMDTGEAYPTFDDTTHVFHVDVDGEHGCEATFKVVKGSKQEVGGNLKFQVARSDGGNPASDGKFYASIAITLQAKP